MSIRKVADVEIGIDEIFFNSTIHYAVYEHSPRGINEMSGRTSKA